MLGVNDQQRKVLLDLAAKLATLGSDDFDYVKLPGVSHETWDELERAGLVETFLATGYGDMVSYRLTDTGVGVLSDASS